ncbi:MAG TPA: hypothetical protein VGA11_04175 [Acidimicrobiia bacterium]
MHAVVVRVTISDFEKARQVLQDEVISRVSAAPGFVTGYWLEPIDGKGLSVIVFEDEDAARSMLAMVQPGSNPSAFVTVESSEVREVVGHA